MMDESPVPAQDSPPQVFAARRSSKVLPILIVSFLISLSLFMGWWARGYFLTSPTATPTIDPTADWKIYSSNKYGWQIRIPLDWTMLIGPPSAEDMFNFRKGDYEFSLSTIPTTAKTIQEYLSKSDKDSQAAWEGASSLNVISTKLTKINNYSVVRREENWQAAAFLKPVVNTYFLSQGRIYSFALKYIGSDSAASSISANETYDQILSTFWLLDQPSVVGTSTWKTYTNTKYGFSFSYPQNVSATEDLKTESYYDKVVTLNGEESFSSEVTVLKDIDIYATSTAESIAGRESNDSGTDHTVSAKTINSYDSAVVRKAANPEIEEVFIKHPSKNVTVKLSIDLFSKNNENIFDQILSTFKFLDQNVSIAPTGSSSAKKLNYAMPFGWQTAKDPTNAFEIGFDPDTVKPSSDSKSGIYLYRKLPEGVIGVTSLMQISLLSYDGGSRHQFIYSAMGATPTKEEHMSNYREREYMYDGKSCLFLENISVSQFPTAWGMCDAGSGQAFLIGSYTTDYLSLLQTLRRTR